MASNGSIQCGFQNAYRDRHFATAAIALARLLQLRRRGGLFAGCEGPVARSLAVEGFRHIFLAGIMLHQLAAVVSMSIVTGRSTDAT